MKVIRTGVIGLGARGLYMARMYSRASHAGFELKAVCDSNPDVLARARGGLGDSVSYYSDHEELLAKADVDAVLVVTGDPHHVGPTVAALRAGKHVLVEKPLCQTVADARLIVEEARKAKGIFMIGFELRECSVFRAMRRLLDEGRIGEVKIGHAFDNVSVGGNYFFHSADKRKAYYKSLLLQKATHSLDLLNWFMGSVPAKVYAVGGLDYYGGREDPSLRCRDCRRRECPYRVDWRGFELDYGVVVEKDDHCVWSRDVDLNDNSQLCISYANGARATFHECHFTPEYSREFWLIGTKGKMYGYYDNPGRFLVRVEYSHAEDRRTEEFRPPHPGGSHGGGDDRLRDEFHRRITENDRPLDALESAYYSTVLAICAEESIGSGRPMNVPPMPAYGISGKGKRHRKPTDG